ncbi:MAG: hypothetical protein ACYCV0_07560 [Desulfitobacteriaceae bacterium]
MSLQRSVQYLSLLTPEGWALKSMQSLNSGSGSAEDREVWLTIGVLVVGGILAHVLAYWHLQKLKLL